MDFRGNQFSSVAFCETERMNPSSWGGRSELQATNYPEVAHGTTEYATAESGEALPVQYASIHPNHQSTCSQHYPSTYSCSTERRPYECPSEVSHPRSSTARTFTPPVVHCRSLPETSQPGICHPLTQSFDRPRCSQRQQSNCFPNSHHDCSQCNCSTPVADASSYSTKYATSNRYVTSEYRGYPLSLKTYPYLETPHEPYSSQNIEHNLAKTNYIASNIRKPVPHHSPISPHRTGQVLYHELMNIDNSRSADVAWEHPGWPKPQGCKPNERNIPLRSPEIGRNKEPKTGNNVCHLCGKSYARPSTLKTHLRTHSGERPYKCSMCTKTFSQTANLTAHLRTHSGEKPYKCHMCQREFSQSSSVTTHMRTHSGERPYRCGFCCKAFADSSTLTKHLRIHSGEKPYQCTVCQLRFSQSGNLTRHMKVHEND